MWLELVTTISDDGFLLEVLKIPILLWQNQLHNTGARHTSVCRQETNSVDNRYTQNKTELHKLLLRKLKCGPSLCSIASGTTRLATEYARTGYANTELIITEYALSSTATGQLLTYNTCIYSSVVELGIQYTSTEAATRISHFICINYAEIIFIHRCLTICEIERDFKIH